VHYYKTNRVDFKQGDHAQLANKLKKIKGKFILSYYDYESVRAYYKAFNIIKKAVPKYCVGCSKNNIDKHKPLGYELLILNY
jgi:site-specific DNA-adenine methylase